MGGSKSKPKPPSQKVAKKTPSMPQQTSIQFSTQFDSQILFAASQTRPSNFVDQNYGSDTADDRNNAQDELVHAISTAPADALQLRGNFGPVPALESNLDQPQ